MSKSSRNIWLINFALSFVGKKELRIVKKVSKNCKEASLDTLRRILTYARDTEWGRAHNFAEILAAESDGELLARWQENVPPADFEDFRPYVERCKNGEENILFPGKPKMYATTSGTATEPKWIPVTNEYYDNVYNRMTRLWLYTFLMYRKHCFEGPALSVVGKAVEGYAPDGTVYGSISGVTRRDVPKFMLPLHSAPAEVLDISDYASRYYVLFRIGLEQDIHVIITANPSTVAELEDNINDNFDDYVNDIEHGTLKDGLDIPQNVRDAIMPLFEPNSARASELRALKTKYGRLLIKHYWPNLCVLNTWKCGNTKYYIRKFKDSLPEGVLYEEFSYFASECRAGLVLNGGDDTVLFPHFHYFEFIEEGEIGSPSPRFKQIYELEKDKRYAVYVTTFAGLYRYNMTDLVEVTGFYGTIPTIQFIQKINGIISMTGEKLSEAQFIEAVERAQNATGIRPAFFVGFADVNSSCYHIYYEFDDDNMTEETAAAFNKRVDDELKGVNVEYAAKRDSFRLKECVPHLLVHDAYNKYKKESLKRHGHDGQFKINLLMQDDAVWEVFKSLEKS